MSVKSCGCEWLTRAFCFIMGTAILVNSDEVNDGFVSYALAVQGRMAVFFNIPFF